MSPRIILGLGSAFALAFFGAAHAATIDVPADQPTIQAAVNVASAGDTIVVKSGTYIEVVSIPSGLDGLTIKGKGTCILDCRPGGVDSGPGFTVASANVTLESFSIRHAKGVDANGVFCATGGDGMTLKKLKVEHCDSDGINVTANGVTAENCVLFGNDGGLRITGNEAVVSKCVVKQDGNDGFTVTGSDALVSKCMVKNVDGNGVDVVGTNAVVEKCKVESADSRGIHVEGSSFAIRNNKILNQGSSNDGIAVEVATSGLVEKNDLRSVMGIGIVVDTSASGVTLRKNAVKEGGAEDDAGIFVDGPQCVVEDNTVSKGQSDGIRIGGASCTVIDNQTSDNGEDGIDVEADLCTISGNKAQKNLAEGIENNGMNTTLTGNSMKKNRIDFANDGTFATPPAGNSFTTGGAATAPEIDD